MIQLFFKRLFLWPVRFYRVIQYCSSLYDEWDNQRKNINSIKFRGSESQIERNVSISWPCRLRIGKHSLIQKDCILHSMGGIHIGDYVGIGSRTVLVSFAHNYLRPQYLPYDNKITIRPIIIRDFVWIGFSANIMPGVEIGEGAVVAMGATVTKNVPPLAVVSGNPAEVVGYRNKKQFELCKKEKKFAGPMTQLFFGGYKEKIPGLLVKKYRQELSDLGLIAEEEN